MSKHLFSPLTLRGLTLRNRIAISPMCTYSATDGLATDFHLVHYGRFGLGGAGLVMVEATSVVPEGRISHGDLGLWRDEQIAPLARIVTMLKEQGAAVGIQLVHAGRKACRQRPWQGNGPLSQNDMDRGEFPWPLKAPSAIAFGDAYPTPEELTRQEIEDVRLAFAAAAMRACKAGFDIVEIHAAHGFLLHSFMSPQTNRRFDEYAGDFEGRHRLAIEVAGDIRAAWPEDKPVFTRVSALDGIAGERDFSETIMLARRLRETGIDVIDCSSGGIGGHSASTSSTGKRGFGFQVPFAHQIRTGAGIASMAVGLITEPELANAVIAEGRADLVAIGRQALVDPNWPLHAEDVLKRRNPAVRFASWPEQYGWWLEAREKVLDGLRKQGDAA